MKKMIAQIIAICLMSVLLIISKHLIGFDNTVLLILALIYFSL